MGLSEVIGLVFLGVVLVGGGTAVQAQSASVSVNVLTGEADIRLGGLVELRCSFIALGLLGASSPVLEWRAGNRTLVWNGVSYDNRYRAGPLVPDPSTAGVMSQRLSIERVRHSDQTSYRCNLRQEQNGGGSHVVASDTAQLTVPEGIFPEGSPVCSPDGARSVPAGETVALRCTTAPGRPEVTLTIQEGSRDVTALFTALQADDRLARRREVTVERTHHGIAFVCTVTSPLAFPGREQSCTMGPLSVSVEGSRPGATHEATTSGPLRTTASPDSVPAASSPSLTVPILASSFGVIFLLFVLVFAALSRSLGCPSAWRAKSLETTATDRETPEFNPYAEDGDGTEVFTTSEGLTGLAYLVSEDGSVASLGGCSIPLYTMVYSGQEASASDNGSSDVAKSDRVTADSVQGEPRYASAVLPGDRVQSPHQSLEWGSVSALRPDQHAVPTSTRTAQLTGEAASAASSSVSEESWFEALPEHPPDDSLQPPQPRSSVPDRPPPSPPVPSFPPPPLSSPPPPPMPSFTPPPPPLPQLPPANGKIDRSRPRADKPDYPQLTRV